MLTLRSSIVATSNFYSVMRPLFWSVELAAPPRPTPHLELAGASRRVFHSLHFRIAKRLAPAYAQLGRTWNDLFSSNMLCVHLSTTMSGVVNAAAAMCCKFVCRRHVTSLGHLGPTPVECSEQLGPTSAAPRRSCCARRPR